MTCSEDEFVREAHDALDKLKQIELILEQIYFTKIYDGYEECLICGRVADIFNGDRLIHKDDCAIIKINEIKGLL